jgi:hypothetical protein
VKRLLKPPLLALSEIDDINDRNPEPDRIIASPKSEMRKAGNRSKSRSSNVGRPRTVTRKPTVAAL